MRIVHFLICDDIRTEITNKHTLVGVYDENIFFSIRPEMKNSWPKQLKIGIFSKIDFEGEKPNSFVLKTKFNGNEKIIGNGTINQISTVSKYQFAIVINNFVFENKGSVTFYFDFYDNTKKLISSLSPDYVLNVDEQITQ